MQAGQRLSRRKGGAPERNSPRRRFRPRDSFKPSTGEGHDRADARHAALRQPQPVATARIATPAPEAAAEAAADAPSATGSPRRFRWPVRGRVIAGFGPKPNGQQNDGINLAVPEGTPVKAAEDGVVAYAGNELKGYGNLVLVRHANGYVTAYAHASELMVKRGDTIKRGQIIAQCRPDRQRDLAAAALRDPQGLDPGRPDAVSRRLVMASIRTDYVITGLSDLDRKPSLSRCRSTRP